VEAEEAPLAPSESLITCRVWLGLRWLPRLFCCFFTCYDRACDKGR